MPFVLYKRSYLRRIRIVRFFLKTALVMRMIYLYRCLGCLEVFSSKEDIERHNITCMRAQFVILTLDEYLRRR